MTENSNSSTAVIDCPESEYSFLGKHYLGSYLDCDHAALTNIDELREAMLQAVQAAGADVLELAYHVFPSNNGFTMMLLLSESHASIHTYPEYNSCFVDIFTCGDVCQPERFNESLQQYLKPKKVTQKMMIRHEEMEDTICS